jgi:hypothetical protein
MGWKNIKEAYRIEHQVRVTSDGICIGSPYIHDIIVIGLDGTIKKRYDDGRINEDLLRYQKEFDAEPEKLRELAIAPDKFTTFIPVYTYDGGEIIQKFCEALGWPNVTHDGDMMYENTFSTDKAKMVKHAKEVTRLEIKHYEDCMTRLMKDHEKACGNLQTQLRNLTKIESDYPDTGETPRAEDADKQPALTGQTERQK